jgi:outer membrane murein-binding lipoprotein Lpp
MRRRARINARRGPGLVGTMARTAVIAGTATATVGAVSGANKQKAAVQQQTSQQLSDLQAQQDVLAAQQQAMAAEAQAPAMNSFDEQLVQIQKLSMLMEQGLLTEEEFQAKKRQVLGI